MSVTDNLGHIPGIGNDVETTFEVLAGGETTLLAAKRFGVAPSRISQLREKLRRLWLVFQGELGVTGRPASACEWCRNSHTCDRLPAIC